MRESPHTHALIVLDCVCRVRYGSGWIPRKTGARKESCQLR